jgi:hypothetical protein
MNSPSRDHLSVNLLFIISNQAGLRPEKSAMRLGIRFPAQNFHFEQRWPIESIIRPGQRAICRARFNVKQLKFPSVGAEGWSSKCILLNCSTTRRPMGAEQANVM